MIVSAQVYLWTSIIGTAGVAFWWACMDTLRLMRALRERPRSPAVRDRIFGSLIGISVGVIGVLGMVLYCVHNHLL